MLYIHNTSYTMVYYLADNEMTPKMHSFNVTSMEISILPSYDYNYNYKLTSYAADEDKII
jgi:hypothetical protein